MEVVGLPGRHYNGDSHELVRLLRLDHWIDRRGVDVRWAFAEYLAPDPDTIKGMMKKIELLTIMKVTVSTCSSSCWIPGTPQMGTLCIPFSPRTEGNQASANLTSRCPYDLRRLLIMQWSRVVKD